MSSNSRQFVLDLRRQTRGLPESKLKDLRDKIALQGLNGVVEMMPVDTGAARGSVQVSEGAIDWRDKGVLDKSGSLAIQAGIPPILAAKPFTILFIASGLPYIEKLEHGSSRQAPNGMFRLTGERLLAQFGE